jgi:branched-chain amino acid transport system permease protein
VNKNRPSRNQWKFTFLAVCFLLLAALPLYFGNTYNLGICILVVYYAFMASAWNIVCGFLGELSLGHSVFVGLGGYTSTLLFVNLGWSPWLGMVAGALVAGITGIIIGYPCFRLRGPYFTLTTIAFAELLRVYVESAEVGPFGLPLKGSMGLLLPLHGPSLAQIEFRSKVPYYYLILAFLILAVLVTYFVKVHRLGYFLVAIRSDPDAAASLGINITKYKLIAMVISCCLIALGGSFYAQYFRYIGPERIFGLDISVQIALIALVGGQGTIFGPIIGALLLVPLGEFLSNNFGGNLPGLHLFIYGIVLMLVVLYLPKGIYRFFVDVVAKAGRSLAGSEMALKEN